MSQQDRDTIAQKIHELMTAFEKDEGEQPPAGLAWLTERALCDLNRIADALEAMALGPRIDVVGDIATVSGFTADALRDLLAKAGASIDAKP